MYKAKNIDTDKALEAIDSARRGQEQQEYIDRAKTQAYYDGVRKGLDIAERLFFCSNYEKEVTKNADDTGD